MILTREKHRYAPFLRICFITFLSFHLFQVCLAQDESPTAIDSKNHIKINPALAFSGDIPLYYERVINRKFSVEVGVGVTLRNYVQDVFDLVDDIDPATRKTRIGYSGRATLRYFPDPYYPAPIGWYFFAQVQYKLFENWAKDCDPLTGKSNSNLLPESKVLTDLRLGFGMQEMLAGERFIIDYYFGLGLRFKETEILICEEQETNPTPKYISFIEKKPETLPNLALGLKLGFRF